jgi:hypothetical protein
MSMHYGVGRPKVTDGGASMPAKPGRPCVRPSQRGLVLASLVRCPGHSFSAKGKKRA